jgi:hypothetical protein
VPYLCSTNNGAITINGHIWGYTNSVWPVALTIPTEIYGLPVTAIGYNAFSYCTNLTSVTIPDSVTSIAEYAFYGCSSLASVRIPDGVTSIGDRAFQLCTSLTNITIGNRVTRLGTAAFCLCINLVSVTIPSSVNDIEAGAFYRCTNLAGVYFKGNAPNIVYSNAFLYADMATVFYLPGTTGWGATFAGRPTAVWVLPYPVILTTAPSFGVQNNAFGFVISWAANTSVVVEACTNPAHPIWSAVGTNTLTSGSSYFSDPQWTNYPVRLYRIRSP